MQIACPKCEKILDVPVGANRGVHCPHCDTTFEASIGEDGLVRMGGVRSVPDDGAPLSIIIMNFFGWAFIMLGVCIAIIEFLGSKGLVLPLGALVGGLFAGGVCLCLSDIVEQLWRLRRGL